MNISLDPSLLEALKSLAAKLGTTVEYLFGVMTRQATTNAIMSLVWCAFALVAFVALIYGIRVTNERDPEWDSPLVPIYGLCLLPVALAFVISLSCGIKGLINPDYYALELLFQAIKIK